MPIYEFQCPNCKTLFEKTTLRASETIEPLCPVCSTKAKKVISRPAIVYEIFDLNPEKLPDRQERLARARAIDKARRDRGKGIKVYDYSIDKRKLEEKADCWQND